MTGTAAGPYDISDPDFVAAYDDLSVWSALAGTLLLDRLPLTSSRGPYTNILDVGCGTGFPLIELAGRFGPSCTVTGIDMWDEALGRARRKILAWGLSNAHVVHGDAAAMEFADETFDLIVSNLGINNFADPAAALSECARVLKPNGTLALTSNLQGHMAEFYDAFRAALEAANAQDAIDQLDAHIATRHSQAEVTALLEHAGFSVDVIERKNSVLRYGSWDAFWHHPFVRLAFKHPWIDIAKSVEDSDIIQSVQQSLSSLIHDEGELRLTVPLAYLEARLTS